MKKFTFGLLSLPAFELGICIFPFLKKELIPGTKPGYFVKKGSLRAHNGCQGCPMEKNTLHMGKYFPETKKKHKNKSKRNSV